MTAGSDNLQQRLALSVSISDFSERLVDKILLPFIWIYFVFSKLFWSVHLLLLLNLYWGSNHRAGFQNIKFWQENHKIFSEIHNNTNVSKISEKWTEMLNLDLKLSPENVNIYFLPCLDGWLSYYIRVAWQATTSGLFPTETLDFVMETNVI